MVTKRNQNNGALGTARPLHAFDQDIGQAAGSLKLAGLDMVGTTDLPPGVLKRSEETLRVLNVKATAVDDDRKRGVEARERGRVVDGADDKIILAGVHLHAVGVGDSDVGDGIASLAAEVAHKR